MTIDGNMALSSLHHRAFWGNLHLSFGFKSSIPFNLLQGFFGEGMHVTEADVELVRGCKKTSLVQVEKRPVTSVT